MHQVTYLCPVCPEVHSVNVRTGDLPDLLSYAVIVTISEQLN